MMQIAAGSVQRPSLALLGADGLAPLRAHCRSLGYDAFDWGQGIDTGPQGYFGTWP